MNVFEYNCGRAGRPDRWTPWFGPPDAARQMEMQDAMQDNSGGQVIK